MGFTLDFSHASASGTTFSLLEKYHNRLCNVHMSNRLHKPFIEVTQQLSNLISMLKQYGYSGPITLELGRKSTEEEIVKTKMVLAEIISRLG